jgi:cytochrome c oxidase assembly protein subunit 11
MLAPGQSSVPTYWAGHIEELNRTGGCAIVRTYAGKMNVSGKHETGKTGWRNSGVVFLCLFLVAGMGALSYASVPLYRLFCQVTGYGGTTRQALNSEGVEILDRQVTVRFDANTVPGLGWEFKPVQRDVIVNLGEITKISYSVENRTDRVLLGNATFNVTPQSVGSYFNKIECFCFTVTVVQPGETLDMPVVFYVDPEMDRDVEASAIHTVTLSYTFFPADEDREPLASHTADSPASAAGG